MNVYVIERGTLAHDTSSFLTTLKNTQMNRGLYRRSEVLFYSSETNFFNALEQPTTSSNRKQSNVNKSVKFVEFNEHK